MAITDADLNYYFNNKVQIKREETKRAKALVLPLVTKILKYVNEKDPRFGAVPLGVGSTYQGLKTKSADEFDFNVILQGTGQWSCGPTQKRYYNFVENIDLDSLETIPKATIVSKPDPLPDPPVGYCFVEIGNKANMQNYWQTNDNLEFKQDLIPILVKGRLKDLIQDAIRNLGLRGMWSLFSLSN
jgi:hypothetical protein